MAESKNIGFRIPADLLAEINARVGGDFRNRTELIIWLLGKGLAIAPTDTPTAPGLDLEARIKALEKEVQTLGTAIQRLTETPNTAIQRLTETPNTVKQLSENAEQSKVSDATIRRLAKKAGLGVADFAAREGWLKQGTGNRATWITL